MQNWFEQLAVEDWTKSVFEATYRINEVRDQVLEALKSEHPEVRSAAVATLNEANQEGAHDCVIELINDSSRLVRDEVYEYLEEFSQITDIPLLIQKLKLGENLFTISRILQKLLNQNGPIIDEDDPIEVISKQVAKWENIIRKEGYKA